MSDLLRELDRWKLDARMEDSERFFYHVDAVDRIRSGDRCFVIGRKGTGKTAISEHLYRLAGPTVFTAKLSFKNFPFNELYALSNDQFPPPNQYITIWKYIIYSSIARLIIPNERIDYKIRGELRSVYGDDPRDTLPQLITRWTKSEAKLGVLGTEISDTQEREHFVNRSGWIEKADILERILQAHLDDCQYILLFDELDEDYNTILNRSKYEKFYALLAGLFKAIQAVRSTFDIRQHKILPVLFLRDDIFSYLKDPDRTKWTDFVSELNWDEHGIQDLLAFRISRTMAADKAVLSFPDARQKAFTKEFVAYGDRQSRRMSMFDYITRSTQIRPRDYIKYIKCCAERGVAYGERLISAETVVQADKTFSNYLRSELEDEIGGLIPEVNKILDLFSGMRRQEVTVEEFTEAYGREVGAGSIPERNPAFVLTVLFHFSVIGNQPSQRNTQVFHYRNREARLNLREKICVHRGLFKALQIL